MTTPHLIQFDLVFVREVQRGQEEVDVFALQPSSVDVLGHDLADKVFARPGPAVQGEGEGLLGVRVVDEARDGFLDDFLGQVLPEELLVQGQLEG